jgi:hypothetical protein
MKQQTKFYNKSNSIYYEKFNETDYLHIFQNTLNFKNLKPL